MHLFSKSMFGIVARRILSPRACFMIRINNKKYAKGCYRYNDLIMDYETDSDSAITKMVICINGGNGCIQHGM